MNRPNHQCKVEFVHCLGSQRILPIQPSARFISLIVLPVSGPGDLIPHALEEHAQPRQRSFSAQLNSRAMIAGFYTHMDALAGPLIKDKVAAARG
jgi:hypothetical protein